MEGKTTGILTLLCIICLSIQACKEPGDPVAPDMGAGRKVFITCEGSFGVGNSSLSLYTPANNTVSNDIYQAKNNFPLGDIFQSMMGIGDFYFLVVNNSDQIVVVQKSNLEFIGTIPVSKPRYILPISSQKAYVSTLYSNDIIVINPSTLSVQYKITLPAKNPEDMIYANGKVLVSCWDTSSKHIFYIDPNTDMVTDAKSTSAHAPQEIEKDKDGNIWILAGNVAKGKSAHIIKMDPGNGNIIKDYAFASTVDPLRLEFNKNKDTLFYIEVNYNGASQNNGVFKMGIYENSLPSQPIITAPSGTYYWGIAIDPEDGRLYVADPKGFNQKGTVSIYNTNGSFVHSFETGTGPGHFYFEK